MEEIKEIISLMIAVIAVTGGLLIPFVIFYVGNKSRMVLHKERMALIEKGINPYPPGGNQPAPAKPPKSIDDPLLWGLLFVGVGIGLSVGYFVAVAYGWSSTILMNSAAILCGGISLISYTLFTGKKVSKKAD